MTFLPHQTVLLNSVNETSGKLYSMYFYNQILRLLSNLTVVCSILRFEKPK
uniref:Uncharacterized protein n=1 Tax=Anguilla anguilla TaxID=7936 RepID=A0A0E9XI52_ANGAN